MPDSSPFGSRDSNAAVRFEPKLDLNIGVSSSGPTPRYERALTAAFYSQSPIFSKLPASRSQFATMPDTSDPSDVLLDRLTAGDETALAEFFSKFRERLVRMVRVRSDPRLLGRIDPEDVLQDAYVNAAKRIDHFPKMECGSPYVWLRAIVAQTLINTHRQHLAVKARDAGREVAIHSGWSPRTTSASIARLLVGNLTSPSRAAIRTELAGRLTTAVESMGENDREVLVLRHFEELTNCETAEVLGIEQKAALES
jgi:RNA polymerase sigma-70 factor (ECF subfamily)